MGFVQGENGPNTTQRHKEALLLYPEEEEHKILHQL